MRSSTYLVDATTDCKVLKTWHHFSPSYLEAVVTVVGKQNPNLLQNEKECSAWQYMAYTYQVPDEDTENEE